MNKMDGQLTRAQRIRAARERASNALPTSPFGGYIERVHYRLSCVESELEKLWFLEKSVEDLQDEYARLMEPGTKLQEYVAEAGEILAIAEGLWEYNSRDPYLYFDTNVRELILRFESLEKKITWVQSRYDTLVNLVEKCLKEKQREDDPIGEETSTPVYTVPPTSVSTEAPPPKPREGV